MVRYKQIIYVNVYSIVKFREKIEMKFYVVLKNVVVTIYNKIYF